MTIKKHLVYAILTIAILTFCRTELFSQNSNFKDLLNSGKDYFKQGEEIKFDDTTQGKEYLSKAIDLLEQAVELNPNSQEAHYFLGFAYDKYYLGGDVHYATLEKTKKISEQFQKVIEISPKYDGEIYRLGPYSKITSMWSSLAMYYLVNGKPDSSLWAFRHGKECGGFNDIILEFCRNLLSSCDSNAILFVVGDNDTYPVWYLQSVENFRTDVAIINLALANTPWYIDMLKNRTLFGAQKIPFSFTDERLKIEDFNDSLAIKYFVDEPKEVSISVQKEILKNFTEDSSIINNGLMNFTFHGRPFSGQSGKALSLIRVQDQVILDILRQLGFKRPVYFSILANQDSFCGLDKFLRYEGLALRVCPVEQNEGSINLDMMGKCLLNVDNSTDKYVSHFNEFKFRSIDSSAVNFDEIPYVVYVYRNIFSLAAFSFVDNNKTKIAVAILDSMNKYISPVIFPMRYDFLHKISALYFYTGAKEQFKKFAQLGLIDCKAVIDNPKEELKTISSEVFGEIIGPYRIAASFYEMLGNYAEARNMLEALHELCKKTYNDIKDSTEYTEDKGRILYNMYDLYTRKNELTIAELRNAGKYKEALDTAKKILKQYKESKDEAFKSYGQYIEKQIEELEPLVPNTEKSKKKGEK